MTRTSTVKQILTALECVAIPGQCIALWVKEAQDDLAVRTKHRTGYFTDPEVLAKAALSYSGRSAGVYITVNPIRRRALDAKTKGWAWNRLSPYPGSPNNAIIFERRRLLVDIDPEPHDLKVSATDAEKRAADQKAKQVREYLAGLGWPEPLVIDSGNGVQMVWRIKLPVGDDGLVKRLLKALAVRFNDSTAKIDPAVSPAKQLMRLAGTMNCKGPNTTERPHRLARIVSAPAKMKLVSKELLEKAAVEDVYAPSASTPCVSAEFERMGRYIDKMTPAVRTNSDGSSKAILAAHAIVVGFDIAYDSEEAWALLKRYNARCRPPWKPHEYDDLRRKLAETDAWAMEHAADRGYLCQGVTRHYEPLPGPLFPMSIPDYGLMAKDTPELVLDKPSFPFAYALRLKAVWDAWQAHAQVPDVAVRAAHWGAKPPKNWRREYRKAFRTPGLKQLAERKKACDGTCPLRDAGIRHRHYYLPYHPCGILDDFRDTNGKFQPRENVPEKWLEHRRKGLVYYGYWPALVFGTSPKVGLNPRQVKLLMAVTRELTRIAKQPKGKMNAKSRVTRESDRADRAAVFKRAMVHNSAYTADKIVCPHLDKSQRYVGFCGNHRVHRGRGYRLHTWLTRSGHKRITFETAESLLTDFAVLAEKFDLIVVGRHHRLRRWYTLAQMHDMVETASGRKRLDELLLRVYGPEDFLTLWRYHFAQWLGFSWIPGTPCPCVEEQIPGHISSGDELRAWMKRYGVTQGRLAKKAGLARRTIIRGLNRDTNSSEFWEKINVAIRQLSH